MQRVRTQTLSKAKGQFPGERGSASAQARSFAQPALSGGVAERASDSGTTPGPAFAAECTHPSVAVCRVLPLLRPDKFRNEVPAPAPYSPSL